MRSTRCRLRNTVEVRQDDLLFVRAGKCLMSKAEAVIVQRASSQEMLHVNICLGGERVRTQQQCIGRRAKQPDSKSARADSAFSQLCRLNAAVATDHQHHTSAGAGSAHGHHARLCVGLQSYRMCEESGHSNITPRGRCRDSCPCVLEYSRIQRVGQKDHTNTARAKAAHIRDERQLDMSLRERPIRREPTESYLWLWETTLNGHPSDPRACRCYRSRFKICTPH